MQQKKHSPIKNISYYFRQLCPIRMLVPAILFTSSATAFAAYENCPTLPAIHSEPSSDEWIDLRQHLGSKIEYCLDNSAFFALYGAALLNSGLTSQAIENLERALLLDPMNGSALIDYAAALYSSGDLITAIQLNEQILIRKDLPQSLHNYLSQRGESWKKLTVNWHNKITLLSGYNNNLNGVSDLKNLVLTLNNQDVVVQLDKNSQPVDGRYDNLSTSTQRITLLEDGFSRLSFNLASRSSDLSRVDTDSFGASYEQETTLEDGSYIWDLGSQYVFYGGKGLYSSINGSVTRYWQRDSCTPYFSGEERLLYFPNQVQYNEAATTLSWGALCELGAGQMDASFSFTYNDSLNHRPGENRFIKEFSLKWKNNVGQGTVSSEISYSKTQDKEGYNVLLSNNATRYTETINSALRFSYPLNKSFSFQSGLYYQTQHSNLSLFNTDSTSADLGIQFKF